MNRKIRERTEKFLKESSSYQDYQNYKDDLVKIIDNMPISDLLDLAIQLSKSPL